MEIQGKVALVTGAGYGIGRAITCRLAEEGASVVVNDIDETLGAETVRIIEEADGKAAFLQADVSDHEDVRRMISIAEEAFAGLDILVNNAANEIQPPFYPAASHDSWRRTLEVCLYGTMSATQQAIEVMSKRGGGAIVNLSSMAGVGFTPHDSPEYAAAKAAIMRFTATLAPFKERMNIRVNAIAPNWVATEKVKAFVPHLSAEQQAAWYCRSLEDMARPEDIADAVVFFIREDSLAGRVMLCDKRDSRWILPVDTNFFALGERLQ
jgi:NAD(P)-dependent dehydrogenase (short-subunit alcohol dehydrogenase family)